MASFYYVRRCDHGLMWWLLSLAAAMSVCAKVEAADRPWRNPAGGTFSNAGNWGSGVPGAGDVAAFGLSTPGIFGALPLYTVSFIADATNQGLRVSDDRVTFDLNGHVYTTSDANVAMQLGTVAGASGQLGVTDGIVILPFQSDLVIASTSGGSGLLAVRAGGLVIGSPDLIVGLNGNGTLNIFDNGDLIADNAMIGANSGSTSTANITGPGSSLLTAGLSVGSSGNGVLNINAGGRVDSAGGGIGGNAGSTGTVNVDGAGSRWNLSGALGVAGSGSGTMNISGGARVDNTTGFVVGILDVGVGAVNVRDSNSVWDNSGPLFIRGALDISAGGAVESTSGNITNLGAVTVHGIGATTSSKWIMSGALTVGLSETSTLSVTEGGLVQNTEGTIDQFGAVTVSNAQWINTGLLTVGKSSGTNTLKILDGGVVRSAGATVSHFMGNSQGAVTVSGANSQWINSGGLGVGSGFPSVEGTLDINNGGRLTNSGSLTVHGTLNITTGAVVEDTDGAIKSGTALVKGATSRWINSGDFTVGFNSTTVDVTEGGFIQSVNGVIGFTSSGQFTVNVSGEGSQWINSGQLTLDAAASHLNIGAGGLVENTDSIIKPVEGSTPNSVSVSGLNARWINSGDMKLGVKTQIGNDGGAASLSITDGGRVENVNAIVGQNGDADVTVSGVNSRWINSGELGVGRATFAGGTMSIRAGGFVQNTIGFIGGDTTFSQGGGEVVVTGAESRGATNAVAVSRWINSDELTVGGAGNATLSIEVGGSVSSGTAYIARRNNSASSISSATVGGSGANWTVNGRLFIGGSEAGDGANGSLRIKSGGTVNISQDTRLFANDKLQLEGGAFSTTDISFNGGGTFTWTSGILHVGIFRGSLVVPSGGILAPGNSAGSTRIEGSFSQQAGGALQIEIGGVAGGTEHDIVDVLGNAALGGNLQLSTLNNFLPSAASTFIILQATGSITGAFANVANGQRVTISNGHGSFLVHYGLGSAFNSKLVVLSAFQAVLPGDYNQNGVVDAADYTVWRDHLGQSFTLTNENPAAATPGVVDAEDHAFWKSRFGELLGSGSGATANATVPEPAALVLLMLAAIGRCVRRSRDA